jgi:hypothetical protein
MTDGVFKLIVVSEQEEIKCGFATFKDGKIRGGDNDFSCNGTYSLESPFNHVGIALDEKETCKENIDFNAKINIFYHKGLNFTILKKITSATVELSGTFAISNFSACGKVKKIKNLVIDLNGIKIVDSNIESSIDNETNILNNAASLIGTGNSVLIKQAIALYKDNSYVDATNALLFVIRFVINKLSIEEKAGESRHDNFLDMAMLLIERNIISRDLYIPIEGLFTSDKLLRKNNSSSEDCASPLCIMAFDSLIKLLENKKISDRI